MEACSYLCYFHTGSAGIVMEGTFLVNDRISQLLFNFCASYSFIAQEFITALGLEPKVLRRPLEQVSLVSKALVLKWAYICI